MKKSLTLILASILLCSGLTSCSESIDDFVRELEENNSTLPKRIEESSEPTYEMTMPAHDTRNDSASDDREQLENAETQGYQTSSDIIFESNIPNRENEMSVNVQPMNVLLPINGQLNVILSPSVSRWYSEINLSPDGSFTGGFYNHSIMDMDEGYENGTMELCEFSGRFTDIKKISNTEYSMILTEFTKKQYDSDSWIENDLRYVPVDTIELGFDSTENVEYRFYLPEHPSSDLPEECFDWIYNTASDGSLGWTVLLDTRDNYAFITR